MSAREEGIERESKKDIDRREGERKKQSNWPKNNKTQEHKSSLIDSQCVC